MWRYPTRLVSAVLAAAMSLALVGCKATPTTETAERPEEAVAEEAHEHDHETAGDEKPEGATEEDVDQMAVKTEQARMLEVLKTGTDEQKLGTIGQMDNLKSPEHREEARKLLRGILMDEEPNPQLQAAGLGQWFAWVRDDPEPALRAVDSPHADVREAAAKALSGADPATARPLLERLKDDPNSTVAATAAEALADVLARSEDGAAVDALIADLGHPDSDRSALAGMRLEQRGRSDHALVDRLTKALQTSTRPAQRASLATVIGLASAGTSPGQDRFSGRVHVLSRAGTQPTEAYTKPVPTLIQVLETDPDPMAREAAAESLGMLGAAEAAPALGKALTDPDEYVRRRAAVALIVVPPDEVKDEVIHAARHDPSAAVRRFAVEAMANLDAAKAADSVMMCLRDPDPEVRQYAAEVLGRVGTQRHTLALLPLFDDVNEDVRWKAVEAVAGFVDPEAKKALLDALWDPSARVALAAEHGLHALGIGKRVLTKAEMPGRRRTQ